MSGIEVSEPHNLSFMQELLYSRKVNSFFNLVSEILEMMTGMFASSLVKKPGIFKLKSSFFLRSVVLSGILSCKWLAFLVFSSS